VCLEAWAKSGLPKVSVQLVDKLTPIITNGWFWECDQDQLPPTVMAMSERYDAA